MPPMKLEKEAQEALEKQLLYEENFKQGKDLLILMFDWPTKENHPGYGFWWEEKEKATKQIRKVADVVLDLFQYPNPGEPGPTDFECFEAV